MPAQDETNAIDYAKFYSRSHDAVTRVYDDAGNVIETYTGTKAISKSRGCAGISELASNPTIVGCAYDFGDFQGL